MKKTILGALIVLSGFNAVPAMAIGDIDTFRFECPNASGGTPSERLTNYGTYIRGMGEENIGGNKTKPIFSGIPGVGVPLNLALGAYVHNGTWYNPSTGRVTCNYKSNIGKPAFNVSYAAMNILDGWVVKVNKSNITIKVLQG
ncbi:MAG: hypothetical protein Q8R83_05070 [Legionellaceae bacterium]|nr:hypothetical protein [Legionellaceae bacterium]